MKNFSLMLATICVLLLVACGNNENTTSTVNADSIVKTAQAPMVDTLSFTPGKIALSEIKTHYLEFPQYDGGEWAAVEFTIGVKISSEEEIYTVKVNRTACSSTDTKGKIKNDEEILEAKHIYEVLHKIDVKNVVVQLVNKTITKIYSKDFIDKNGNLVPSEVFWGK